MATSWLLTRTLSRPTRQPVPLTCTLTWFLARKLRALQFSIGFIALIQTAPAQLFCSRTLLISSPQQPTASEINFSKVALTIFQFCSIFLTLLTQITFQGQPCLRLLLTMLQLLTLFRHTLTLSSPIKASPTSLRKLAIFLLHLSHQSLLISH